MEAIDLTAAAQRAVPPRRRVEALWLGRIGYGRALVVQREAASRVARGGPETLLLLEHEPVFTLGRNASERDVLFTPERRRELGIDLFEADRGGKVTYHGPGQLVGYPILNLSPDRRDVRRYVGDLCEVLVRTLAELGVEAAPRPSPHVGVWVGEEKIASLGVHLSRWITTHGFALNVTTDVSAFAGIVPCGLPGIALTSIARQTGVARGVEEIGRGLVPHFVAVFERDAVEAAPPAEMLAEAGIESPLGAAALAPLVSAPE